MNSNKRMRSVPSNMCFFMLRVRFLMWIWISVVSVSQRVSIVCFSRLLQSLWAVRHEFVEDMVFGIDRSKPEVFQPYWPWAKRYYLFIEIRLFHTSRGVVLVIAIVFGRRFLFLISIVAIAIILVSSWLVIGWRSLASSWRIFLILVVARRRFQALSS